MICDSCGAEIDIGSELTVFDETKQYCSNLCAKDADSKDGGRKFDTGKLRYDLIPPEAMEALARVLTYGAAKYEPNNWQKLDDFKARYTAAMYRHLEAWRKGEEKDAESGIPHLEHALCNLAFLVWKGGQDGTQS